MEYLIDVRSPEVFSGGHYEGAVNHELVLLEDGLLPDYPKDADIYLYCQGGVDAEKAKGILEKNGFSHVINLGGYNPDLDVDDQS